MFSIAASSPVRTSSSRRVHQALELQPGPEQAMDDRLGEILGDPALLGDDRALAALTFDLQALGGVPDAGDHPLALARC